jgi:hypothetical protein
MDTKPPATIQFNKVRLLSSTPIAGSPKRKKQGIPKRYSAPNHALLSVRYQNKVASTSIVTFGETALAITTLQYSSLMIILW